jgi:SAM-dependent methyltransferase
VALVITAALARRGVAAPSPSPAPAAEAQAPAGEDAAPTAWQIALWLALAAVPSGLMLSTTTYLTTDIFAMPLLWVIPLGLYLLSFSIAFAAKQNLARAITVAAPVVLAAGGALAMLPSAEASMAAVAASLIMLFAISVTLHARLYADRPAPARLTQFYLVMSAGGVLGGAFTALIAPLVFDWTWEHPLLVLAAAALVPLGAWSGLLGRVFRSPDAFRMGVILLLFLTFVGSLAFHAELIAAPKWSLLNIIAFILLIAAAVLLAAQRWSYVAACCALIAALGATTQAQLTFKHARSRSYFGIYTVTRSPDGARRQLQHGTTLHGVQRLGKGLETDPTSYYGATGGAGLTLSAAQRLYGPAARIGVVGLGVGTLACYGRPGQRWTFFEIDREVLAYSTRRQFTFLERCAPEAPVVIGDARLKLDAMPENSFDILVIDAFSSDAIPLHLLTEEASRVYFRNLAKDGLLLIHISNRYIKLEPVLAALAREEGLAAAIRPDRPQATHLTASDWVVLSRDPAKLAELTRTGGWRPLAPPASTVWRDDYASILPQIMWSNFL